MLSVDAPQTNASAKAEAPILQLPPEIVVLILELLLDRANPGVKHYHQLIRVSHVNSGLRHTCITSPSLWKTIFIDDAEASYSLAAACVNRSGEASLDITMRVVKQMRSRIGGIIRLLQYTSHRIGSLTMSLALPSEASWTELVSNLGNMNMPQLHALSADVWVRGRSELLPPRPILLLPGAPNLRSLSLVSLATQTDAGRLSTIRRLCLTTFTFWAWPYTVLVDMLRSCERLTELELFGKAIKRFLNPGDVLQLPPVLPIPLPELLRLSVTGLENALFLYLLLNIEAPRLEFVKVDIPHWLSTEPAIDWKDTAIAEADRLAFPSVRSLKLVQRTIEAQEDYNPSQTRFGVFLSKAFPNLEEVEIPTSSINILSLCSPMGGGTGQPLWIHLTRLSVLKSPQEAGCWECHAILQTVFWFLRQRETQGLSKLSFAKVEICLPVLDRDVFEQWFKLMEEGAELEIVQSQPGNRSDGCVTSLAKYLDPDL
ncbi:hypothetical protein FRC04_004703 [Tulasnella sp. 424]|nr:hypothetical protein FRC04_004703 [Tulasnella sp. 424]